MITDHFWPQEVLEVVEVRPRAARARDRERVDRHLCQPRLPLSFEDRVGGGHHDRTVAVTHWKRLRHDDRVERADVVGDEDRGAGERPDALALVDRQPAEARQRREEKAALQGGAHPPHTAGTRPFLGLQDRRLGGGSGIHGVKPEF